MVEKIMTWMFFIAMSMVIIYFFVKLVSTYLDYKKRKYSDHKAEFVSDLYRIQNKWAKRGRIDYAQAVNLIVEAFNLPSNEKEAETEYGKAVSQALMSLGNEQ